MSNVFEEATKRGKELPGYAHGAKLIRVDEIESQIDFISGIVYAQVHLMRASLAIRRLHMSLMVPRDDGLKPAIVYFPGGGFVSANHEQFLQMRFALAKGGFVVASAEYRTVPDTYPGLVEDGKSAIRFLRAHAAAYGIDLNRIGALGDSAGGYLAQMVGLTHGEKAYDQGDYLDQTSSVQAAATIFGISNLLNIGEGFSTESQQIHQSPSVTEALLVNGPAFDNFPGASIASDPEKARAASPMGHIDGKHPPFLIMHGTADTLVSPIQSKQLYEALSTAGRKPDYVLVEGAGHGGAPWHQKPIIDTVVNWFKTNLA
ncbi:alpha/beta hydrolase [Oryzifoliimicrobium ureilyticus]|uniref:alpha/beta hydrolase n=1 Tax=Oryzifoliimicrobium ureilyticus TaxID=3113724 RepID=UPI00307676BB